jgi:hypothetical protein
MTVCARTRTHAGNPGNQISSRFDLVPKGDNPPNPNLVRAAFGGIDSKITSKALVRHTRACRVVCVCVCVCVY